jgi:hypothetical protein
VPWTVAKTDKCPPDKPWGVINQQTGAVPAGRCHASEGDARKQQAVLYVLQKQGKIKDAAGDVAVSEADWQAAMAVIVAMDDAEVAEVETAALESL